jgi:hypothetical protein
VKDSVGTAGRGQEDLLRAACDLVMTEEVLRLNGELEMAERRRLARLRCRCWEDDEDDL